MSKRKEVTYSNYLHVNDLISKQNKDTLSFHDEHLFITVHQNFEIWFCQIIFELDSIKDLLEKSQCSLSRQEALLIGKRILRSQFILQSSMTNFDILGIIIFITFKKPCILQIF
jgi:tryptophan 2,3-dioxygenase